MSKLVALALVVYSITAIRITANEYSSFYMCKRYKIFNTRSTFPRINEIAMNKFRMQHKIEFRLFVKIIHHCAPRKIRRPERRCIYNYVRKYSFMQGQGDNCTGMSSPFWLSRNYARVLVQTCARTRPPLLPRASCNNCMSKTLVIIPPVRMKIIHRTRHF